LRDPHEHRLGDQGICQRDAHARALPRSQPRCTGRHARTRSTAFSAVRPAEATRLHAAAGATAASAAMRLPHAPAGLAGGLC